MLFHRFLQYFRVIFTKRDSFVHLERLKCVINASIRKLLQTVLNLKVLTETKKKVLGLSNTANNHVQCCDNLLIFNPKRFFSAASVCQSSCSAKTGRIPNLEELLFLSQTSASLSDATKNTRLELNLINSRKQQFFNESLTIECALVSIYFDFGSVFSNLSCENLRG